MSVQKLSGGEKIVGKRNLLNMAKHVQTKLTAWVLRAAELSEIDDVIPSTEQILISAADDDQRYIVNLSRLLSALGVRFERTDSGDDLNRAVATSQQLERQLELQN